MKEKIEKAVHFFHKYRAVFYLLLVVIIAVLPFFMKTSKTRILCRMLVYCTLAGSLNMINGYIGQTCLGQAGFLGVGAYTMAILLPHFPNGFWPLLILSGITTALISLIIAIPTLRLKGIYFTMITLGAAEVLRIIELNWTSFTGGAFGIKGIARPSIFGFRIDNAMKFTYFFLILAIIFLFVSNRVLKSRVGRAWMAIREGEMAAASLGVEVYKYKIINLMYGAFWAGLVGGVYATYLQYIDSGAFGLDEGFNILSMVVIGGQGTLAGPIVGAFIVNFLTEALRAAGNWRYVIYGMIIILMMRVRPQGLVGRSMTRKEVPAASRASVKAQTEGGDTK